VNEREFVAQFQEELRGTYPVAGELQELQILMGSQGIQPSQSARQWRFADRPGDWVVVLGEAALALETRRYVTGEDFLARLEPILRALETYVKPGVLERSGLRYINEIRVPAVAAPANWNGLIRDQFLGPVVANVDLGRPIQQMVQQLVLGTPVDQKTIRHGHFLDGTTVVSPAPSSVPTGPFYLLDFDHSSTAQTTYVPDDTLALIDRFHNDNYKLFRSAITENLYALFEKPE
jgi:uncharacterized protein (TIGR04255 family)